MTPELSIKFDLDAMHEARWPFPLDKGRAAYPLLKGIYSSAPVIDPGYINHLYLHNQWGSRRNRRVIEP